MSTVFSTKVLTSDTIFTSPNGDRTAILRGHPSRTKVKPRAVQREYLHVSVILRPWVIVRHWETNCPQVLNWLQSISTLLYYAYYTKAEEGLPTSDFWLPTSDLRLPTWQSANWFLTVQTQSWMARPSDLPLPTPHFPLPNSHFRLLISHFSLPTSHFLLLTSDFRFPTQEKITDSHFCIF